MPPKPATAAAYSTGLVEQVRAACLTVAVALGDLRDDIVVVGGLVPALLIAQDPPPRGADRHVGTMDLDLGLTVALLEEDRYEILPARLRGAGFTEDVNERGMPTPQRWRAVHDDGTAITVDFLIPPSLTGDQGGRIRHIESDFAALITPGLELAFRDRELVRLTGPTIHGDMADRMVWVCGPGAYVVLKALAFAGRGEPKDAYDLYYVVRNYGRGVNDVAQRLAAIGDQPDAMTAMDILRRDFANGRAVGPSSVGRFLYGRRDPIIEADVEGFSAELLRLGSASLT